jgi:hypothetical protein
MKYMTPDLIARSRSHDRAVAEAAEDDWEQRGEEYQELLKELLQREDFPAGAKRFLRRYDLHDSKLTTIGRDEKGDFSLFIEATNPAHPPDKDLELQYRLVGPEGGIHFVLHPGPWWDNRASARLLYDELEPVPNFPGVFTHSLLFEGGLELQFMFSNMRCRRINFLFSPAKGIIDIKDPEVVRRLKMLAHWPEAK